MGFELAGKALTLGSGHKSKIERKQYEREMRISLEEVDIYDGVY